MLLGAEALARWHDPDLGWVAPAEFVPLAERVGIIGNLDDWILRRSLQEAASWRRAGLDLTVAVNVSAIELRNRDLVSRVRSAIRDAKCDPAQLVVELTESAVAEDPAEAVRQLRALKELGVSLSLDDFGTGYSSLSHLRQFPFDSLKIDRSFVIDLPGDPDACAIARAIVALARSLGIETVAEGVETEAQRDFLKELHVDIQQGFLHSRPLPPDEFLAVSMAGSAQG
jgi:EAL domain-containing protein (putative c-di-GMP-specific phosphodiesterase class I)